MDAKFGVIFFIATLILEIIPSKRFMEQVNTYRITDYSDIDDKVTATQIKSGSYKDDKKGWVNWAMFEWYYNGKRRRATLYDTLNTFPYEMQITVNRKTGRYKEPEGERRVHKLNVLLVLLAVVGGYIIASLICGYSPLFE